MPATTSTTYTPVSWTFEEILSHMESLRKQNTYSMGSIIDWLKNSLGEASVEVKTDLSVPAPLAASPSRKEAPKKKDKKPIKVLLEHGRDGKYSLSLPSSTPIPSASSGDGRIMFVVDMFSSQHGGSTSSASQYMLRCQCRGIIVDLKTCHILAYPPRPLSNDYSVKKVNLLLGEGKYRAYKMRDGTSITLYKYKGRLCMGSASRIDISDSLWNEGMSFRDMFMEAASHHAEFMTATGLRMERSSTGDNALAWSLSSRYSVTLGMRHHNIHQLRSNPEGLWFIRSYDTRDRRDVELPELSSLPKNEEIPRSDMVSMTYDSLMRQCASSIEDAIECRAFNYGFILQADPPLDGEMARYNRLALKSPLYLFVEDFSYRMMKYTKRVASTIEDRVMYSTIEALLRGNSTRAISTLLPQYGEVTMQADRYINGVVKAIIDHMRGQKSKDSFVISVVNDIYTHEPDLRSALSNGKPVNLSYLLQIVKSFVYGNPEKNTLRIFQMMKRA